MFSCLGGGSIFKPRYIYRFYRDMVTNMLTIPATHGKTIWLTPTMP